jgi:hypothetical protein
MTFTYPEHLREVQVGGRWFTEREPGHATRLARATDYNTWTEDPATVGRVRETVNDAPWRLKPVA